MSDHEDNENTNKKDNFDIQRIIEEAVKGISERIPNMIRTELEHRDTISITAPSDDDENINQEEADTG